jgi:hypothetical protein
MGCRPRLVLFFPAWCLQAKAFLKICKDNGTSARFTSKAQRPESRTFLPFSVALIMFWLQRFEKSLFGITCIYNDSGPF